MKFVTTPLIYAVVALAISSVSGFVPSTRMVSSGSSVRKTQQKADYESVLRMSDKDVSYYCVNDN
jgi:hypothetical protein